MALSSLINRLIPEGTVLSGRRPQTILADGPGPASAPGYYDTSRSGNLLRTIDLMQKKKMLENKHLQEKQQQRQQMYKTLRDAGYEPKQAFEAVLTGFPSAPGGLTPEEKKAEEASEKNKAQTRKIKEETETIRAKRTPELDKLNAEAERVKAQTEELRGDTGKDKSVMVAMTDPAGRKKLVPRENVQKAIERGWKLR